MNLGAIKSGAMLAGAMIGGGALVGAGIGAVQSLGQEPDPSVSGLTGMEKRNTLKSAIVGAGAGALGGVALLGAKKLVTIPVIKNMPLPAVLALGGATGAAAGGAYALGRNVFN